MQVTPSRTRLLTAGLSPVESVQKSPAVVRPKDSAAPLNCKEAWSSIEESQSTFQEELNVNDQIVHSYQQISCLDSVMRYVVDMIFRSSKYDPGLSCNGHNVYPALNA